MLEPDFSKKLLHATADERSGFMGLLEVPESGPDGDVRSVRAATAVSEGITGLLEVTESDFPSLSNSAISSNSCLGLSTSASARVSRNARAVASARVCLVSSSSAESAAVAHAHASILHGACYKSWSDTGSPRRRKWFQMWGFRLVEDSVVQVASDLQQ